MLLSQILLVVFFEAEFVIFLWIVKVSVNQRIGVSGIATAFRIISRFCLNRIWLEELNQLCPWITGMTLEESLESRGQSIDSFISPCPSSDHLGVLVVQWNCWFLGLPCSFLDIWTLNPSSVLTVSRGYVFVLHGQVDFLFFFFFFFRPCVFLPWLLRSGYQLLIVARCLPKGLL